MGRKANTSSVKTEEGYKIAAYGNQIKNEIKLEKNRASIDNDEQIVNARKAKDLALAKAKAKKRAKMAKASKKKNKK
jgi:hypothetical protein